MNLFVKTTYGRFRPSWWSETPKVARVNVTVNGESTFPSVRAAAEYRPLFRSVGKNVIR